MPIQLNMRQRLLWDVSPIGDKRPSVMYAGLMYAATCTMLPNMDVNQAHVQTLKWTSLLLTSFDTQVTASLDRAQNYVTTKFGNRTLAIIATRILAIWLKTRSQRKKERQLDEAQTGEIIYHLSGIIVVLSSILALQKKTLDDLYEQLLP